MRRGVGLMVSEEQKRARRSNSGKTYTCKNCGCEFEEWLALIDDSFSSITDWVKRKEEYEHLCQDCDEEYFYGELGFN
jgi:hypothetical protein